MRLGGLGLTNPCRNATKEYKASIRVTQPLVKQIEAQALELPDDDDIQKMQQFNRRENEKHPREKLEEVRAYSLITPGEPLSLLQKRARLVG